MANNFWEYPVVCFPRKFSMKLYVTQEWKRNLLGKQTWRADNSHLSTMINWMVANAAVDKKKFRGSGKNRQRRGQVM